MEFRPAAHQCCFIFVDVRDTEIPSHDIPKGGAGAEVDVDMPDHLIVVLQELLELVISGVGQGGDFLKENICNLKTV